MIILGLTFGCALSGKLLGLGRRNCWILSTIVSAIGIGITLQGTFPYLMTGRFIFGLACGVFSVVTPKFTSEHVPNHLYDTISPFYLLG